ncbi:hypothetical protein AB4097_03645 [Microvirga sp. 2MCAF35]|uniref:hypothetical protein n=1 Tax=Microvirga sp. 2MCAF35 TaxID=3232987 RepID=UPI003F9902A1
MVQGNLLAASDVELHVKLKLAQKCFMTNLHQQISDLEAEIDALTDDAEQCRKSMVVAKAAVGLGILLFAASLLGLLRFDAIILVVGIAAALGGTVFYGSSRSSLEGISARDPDL